jgi:hypothetical protein
MLLLYTADDSNVHQVEPVTAGERATLTMWFTLHQEHQEDAKVSSSRGFALMKLIINTDLTLSSCKLEELTGVQGLSCSCSLFYASVHSELRCHTCWPTCQFLLLLKSSGWHNVCTARSHASQLLLLLLLVVFCCQVLAALSSPAMCGSGLPPTMYQQTPDGPDIRLVPLQQLGVELVSRQQQHVQQQQQQAPAGPQQEQQEQQQQDQEHQQEFALLAAGQTNCDDIVCFSSIQQAVLVLYMLQWKLCPHRHPLSLAGTQVNAAAEHDHRPGDNSAANLTHQQLEQQVNEAHPQLEQQVSQVHVPCGCYTDAKLLSRARQLLQEYLAAAEEQLEQLLPLWQQLGALVAPAASEQHHIHVVADCG